MCKPESSREIAAVMIALMQGRMTSHADDYYRRLAVEFQGDGVSQSIIDLIVASVDGLWLQAAVTPTEQVARRATQIRLQLRRLVDSDLSKHAAKNSLKKQLVKGASR